MDSRCLPVGVALGSNLADRESELEAGFAFIQALASDGQIKRSSIIETAPVDCAPGSPSFLNAVAEIQVDPAALPPDVLLARLQAFEVARGRPQAHARNSARPLDLDILYYGDRLMRTPVLTVPHPRITERPFVLLPLSELRPDLILPGETRSVRELLAAGAGPISQVRFGMDREQMLKIERLAYHLWEQDGCPPGAALANWLKAEKQLSEGEFLQHELEVEVVEGGLVPEPDGKTVPPIR